VTKFEATSLIGKVVYIAKDGEVETRVVEGAVRSEESSNNYYLAYENQQYRNYMTGSYGHVDYAQLEKIRWVAMPTFWMFEQTAIAVAYDQIQCRQHFEESQIKASATKLENLNGKYDKLAERAQKASVEMNKEQGVLVTSV
jgi:hypothetical protein